MQGSITGQISALSSTTKPLTSNSGVNWKLTNPLVTPATLGSNLNSVRNVQSPDGQSAVASVRDLDLSTYALDLRIKGNNATTNVDATISKESSKVTVDVDKSFAKVNSSVTDSLGPITNDFNKAATEFIKSVNDVFDTQVKQFDGIR